MDKKDALGYYLLLVAGTWVVFPTELLLTQQWSSAYGFSLFLDATIIAVILATVGISVYLYFRLRQDFQINLHQMPEDIRLKRIDVIVGPNEIRTTNAHFYTFYVCVRRWSESFEGVHFHFRQFHPETQEQSTLFQLKNIPAAGNSVLTLRWSRTKEDFDGYVDGFASAVNDSEEVRIDDLPLPAGGKPVPFVLFFTYPSSDLMYFPSVAQRTYPLNGEYRVELWVRATGKGERRLKTILIDARRGWDQIGLREA